jgi:hypothetical protein
VRTIESQAGALALLVRRVVGVGVGRLVIAVDALGVRIDGALVGKRNLLGEEQLSVDTGV